MRAFFARGGRGLVREIPVPAIMLLCVGAYWMDAAELSVAATVFPLALTVVIVSVVTGVLVMTATSRAGAEERPASEAGGGGLAVLVRTWAVVLLPVPLILLWREIGALPALALLTVLLLAILRERRWPWLIALPALLSAALVYLFKTLLYVRLPDIPWLGG